MTSSFVQDWKRLMISLPASPMTFGTITFGQLPTMTTIRTHQDNGPYFGATKGCYQAARLSDILRHVRLAMEDREDIIAIFDQTGACKGLWHRELEGHVDSAGDTIVDHEGYEKLRPSSSWQWNYLVEKVK